MQRLFKTPAQPEGDPVAQQTTDNPCQPGVPETYAPSPAISTVPGRIKPTSASDSRKATNTTAINEYTVDWVIKCSSNACIMCPVDEFVVDCAKWWYSGQSILCMNIFLQRESFSGKILWLPTGGPFTKKDN